MTKAELNELLEPLGKAIRQAELNNPYEGWEDGIKCAAKAIADVFEAHSSNFDRQLFMVNCGFGESRELISALESSHNNQDNENQ